MKKFIMLFTVCAAVISLSFIPSTARGEIVWKLAHKQPPASPEGNAFQLFADVIEKQSNGKMKVKVYHSEQLGGVRVSLDMVRKNTIQIWIKQMLMKKRFSKMP